MKVTITGEVLVDEHAEMAALLQRSLHGEGRALAGRLQIAHGLAADLVQTRAMAGSLGARNTAVVSSPKRAAQIAGSFQLARWAEKIRPGLPSSLRLEK